MPPTESVTENVATEGYGTRALLQCRSSFQCLTTSYGCHGSRCCPPSLLRLATGTTFLALLEYAQWHSFCIRDCVQQGLFRLARPLFFVLSPWAFTFPGLHIVLRGMFSEFCWGAKLPFTSASCI